MNEPRAFILDLDGVVYRGNQVIPGAPAFFQQAARHGCRWLFVSNNSTRTPAEFAAKLTDMGIPTPAERVITSAEVTAAYVREQLAAELGRPPRLLVIGEQGLRSLLVQAGATVLDWPNRLSSAAAQPAQAARPAQAVPVDAVVAGLDTEFSFAKLRIACYWIRRGARFIGTNPDRTFPYPDGIGPGAGTILAALQACTDVEPLVMGKPRPPMLQAAWRRLSGGAGRSGVGGSAGGPAVGGSAGGPAAEGSAGGPAAGGSAGGPTAEGSAGGSDAPGSAAPAAGPVWVIGDRLDTDVAGANAVGLPSYLVLTGVTSPAQVAALSQLPAAWRPTRVVESLAALAAELWGEEPIANSRSADEAEPR